MTGRILELKRQTRYFLNWLRSEGVRINKIDLKYFTDNYRGVVATDNIRKNETILSVPLSVMMTSKAPLLEKITGSDIELNRPEITLLSLLVLQERANSNSKFTHFFKSLPESVSNFPLFFTDAEMRLLANTEMPAKLNKLKKDFQGDYELICRTIPNFHKIATLDAFMKEQVLVRSRAFNITMNGEHTPAIIPLADMFNYDPEKSEEVYWAYFAKTKEFKIVTQQHIKAGEEIFIDYGEKDNLTLLMNYGFIILNNENDCVELDVSTYLNPVKGGLKSTIIPVLSTNINDENFEKVISYLRYVSYEGPYIMKVRDEYEMNEWKLPPISYKNEVKALRLLKRICVGNMRKVPSSIERTAYNKDLTNNQRNCMLYQLGEKRIYKLYAEIAQIGLDALCKKKEVTNACIKGYIKSILCLKNK